MTGYGEAHRQAGPIAVAVEVRTINNRYLKLSLRATEGYGLLEPQIENLIRSQIKRGTVQVNLRVDRAHSADDYRLNTAVLEGYRKQLNEYTRSWHSPPPPVSLEAFLTLPGVVEEHGLDASRSEQDWPAIQATLQEALARLGEMRAAEGQAMGHDLTQNCEVIRSELDKIAARAPQAVEAYRSRLEERLRTILAEQQVVLNPADLIREVAIYADRTDIAEEIVRLRSHLEQFAAIMRDPDSVGRKLEFLAQEMLRETNTIGSKSTDVEIARQVIEIKTAIERIKEMIQNVE